MGAVCVQVFDRGGPSRASPPWLPPAHPRAASPEAWLTAVPPLKTADHCYPSMCPDTAWRPTQHRPLYWGWLFGHGYGCPGRPPEELPDPVLAHRITTVQSTHGRRAESCPICPDFIGRGPPLRSLTKRAGGPLSADPPDRGWAPAVAVRRSWPAESSQVLTLPTPPT